MGPPTPLILTTAFSISQNPNKTRNWRQELWVKYLNQITSWIFISTNVNHKYGTVWSQLLNRLIVNGTTSNMHSLGSFGSYWFSHGTVTICWRTRLPVYKHWQFRSIKQLWIYFFIGSLNLVFENTRTTAKRAVVRGDLLKISIHAKSHNTMYIIVNQKNIINVTLSGVVTQNTNPLWQTIHIIVRRLRERKTSRLKLLLDGIKCFVLLIFVKIILFADLQKWNSRFCLSMNWTYVIITYCRIQNMLIVLVLLFYVTVL